MELRGLQYISTSWDKIITIGGCRDVCDVVIGTARFFVPMLDMSIIGGVGIAL